MIRPEVALPPLSPVLLAGLLARPLPLAPLQPFLSQAMKTTSRRHQALFERLECLTHSVFLIDPIDLPFGFELNLDVKAPSLKAVRGPEDLENGPPAATIRGPLAALVGLLEGRTDGDALFFSRAITVEGDTEAVLALRNAVDSAEIDLHEDILSRMGPFSPLARRFGPALSRLYARLEADLALIQKAAGAPLQTRLDQQAAKAARLEEKIQDLQKQARRQARKSGVKAEAAA